MKCECPSCTNRRKYQREYYGNRYKNDPEFKKAVLTSIKKYNKKMHIKIKTQLAEILGGTKCSNCPVTDLRLLEFHHRFFDGNIDRKRFKHTDDLYKYYIDRPTEAKEKLQVLCANCHKLLR